MDLKPYKTKIIKRADFLDKLDDYILFVGRETCLTRDEIWISWLVDWGVSDFLYVPKKDIYDYYFDEKSFLDFVDRHSHYLLSNLDSHLASYNTVKNNILKSAKQLSQVCQKKDNDVIIKNFLEHNQYKYQSGDYIHGAWDVIYKIESEVLDSVPQDIELITALDTPIDYLKMERDLFVFESQELVKKYAWLNIYNPYDKIFDEKDFVKLKKEKNKDNIEKQFAELEKTANDFEKYITTIKDNDLKNKIKLVHAYAYLKTDRIDVWRQAIYFMSGFYNYLADLSGFSIEQVSHLSILETVDILKGKKVDSNILERRKKHKSLYHIYKDNIDELIDSKQIAQIIAGLENKNLSDNTIKGIVASKGQAKGTVKIITSSSQINKVKTGDILVAKYTFPSFTPAMKRAAAIVTDEGGLTSHAAIVSRELKKPCIVGVSNATKILKDGDMVEIDAIGGIIKKIKD